MPDSLLILGCSERKRQASRPIPAIDRYDGPTFRVLRKHATAAPESMPLTWILSARFGLIPGSHLVPRYDHRLRPGDLADLGTQVEKQLKKTLRSIRPDRLFVSVGRRYWPLIEAPLTREAGSATVVVATGGIGGRASQLGHWLRYGSPSSSITTEPNHPSGEATLLGRSVRLSREEVLRIARAAISSDPRGASRFETWYVPVGHERVAPKWLVSLIFNKRVAEFRTADARRVLRELGIETRYAN